MVIIFCYNTGKKYLKCDSLPNEKLGHFEYRMSRGTRNIEVQVSHHTCRIFRGYSAQRGRCLLPTCYPPVPSFSVISGRPWKANQYQYRSSSRRGAASKFFAFAFAWTCYRTMFQSAADDLRQQSSMMQ